MRIVAHVYPGWHPIPERDESFHSGFTEWELVRSARPQFEGHLQPRVPLLGTYDDRDPVEVERRVRLALEHGVDALCYGFFWCRGKRVFEDALDLGFLGAPCGSEVPFAVMWANRMPRRVLPVRRTDLPVIDPARRVSSDIDDFVALITTLAKSYFSRSNYLTFDGKPYFAIFDSTFFLRELGLEAAREAVQRARAWLRSHGFPGLFLAAVDPAADVISDLRSIGFDAVTHYVLLPEWKGERLQDYASCAAKRAAEWPGYARDSSLPYLPSIATGWDATPRGADFGDKRPDRYPWSPIVVGATPDRFRAALEQAIDYARVEQVGLEPTGLEPTVFVASLNEWSEGHVLEPDEQFGNGWLEAVRSACESGSQA